MAFPGAWSPGLASTPAPTPFDEPRPSQRSGGFASMLRPGTSSHRGESPFSPSRQLRATDLVRDAGAWLSRRTGRRDNEGWYRGGGETLRPWRGAPGDGGEDAGGWRNPAAEKQMEAAGAAPLQQRHKEDAVPEEDEEEVVRRVMEQSRREAEGHDDEMDEREARELEEALALSRSDIGPSAPQPQTGSDGVTGRDFASEPDDYSGSSVTYEEDEDPDAELSRALRESERALRQASLALPDSPTTALARPDDGLPTPHLPPGARPIDEKDFLEEDRMLELAVRLSLEERALYEEARRMSELAETTAAMDPPPTPSRRAHDDHRERGRRRVPPLPKPVTPSPVLEEEDREATPKPEAPQERQPSDTSTVPSGSGSGSGISSSAPSAGAESATTHGLSEAPALPPRRPPTAMRLEEQLAQAATGRKKTPSPQRPQLAAVRRDPYERKPLTPKASPPLSSSSLSDPSGVVVATEPAVKSPPKPARPPPPLPPPSMSARKLPPPPPVPPKRPLDPHVANTVAFPTAPPVYDPPPPPVVSPDEMERASTDSDAHSERARSARSSVSSGSDGGGLRPGMPATVESYRTAMSGPPSESYYSPRESAEAIRSDEAITPTGMTAPAPPTPSAESMDDSLSDSDENAVGAQLDDPLFHRPSLGVGSYDAQRSLSHITEQTEPEESVVGASNEDDAAAVRRLAGAETGLEDETDEEDEDEMPGIVRFRPGESPIPSPGGDDRRNSEATARLPASPTTPRAETPATHPVGASGTTESSEVSRNRSATSGTVIMRGPRVSSTLNSSSHAGEGTSGTPPRDSPGFGSAVRFGFPDVLDAPDELAPATMRGGMPDVVMLSRERQVFDERDAPDACAAIGPVWAVDAASWSLLLRFLMWYGDTQLRASPADLSASNEMEVPKGRRSAALSVEFRKSVGQASPGCVRLAVRLIDEDAEGGYDSAGSAISSGGESGAPLNKRVRRKLQRKRKDGKGKAPAVERPASTMVTITRIPLPDAVVLPTRLAQLAVTLFTLGHLAGIAVSTQGSKDATASYRELRRLGGLIAELAAAQKKAAIAANAAGRSGDATAAMAANTAVGDEKLIGRMRERLRRLRSRGAPANAAGDGETMPQAEELARGSVTPQPAAGQSVMQENSVAAHSIEVPVLPELNLGNRPVTPTPNDFAPPYPSRGETASSDNEPGPSTPRLRHIRTRSIEKTHPLPRDRRRMTLDDDDEDDERAQRRRQVDEWEMEDHLRWLPALGRQSSTTSR